MVAVLRRAVTCSFATFVAESRAITHSIFCMLTEKNECGTCLAPEKQTMECILCNDTDPELEFVDGCKCTTKRVHSHCMIRAITSNQRRWIKCPACQTGEFSEKDALLVDSAQRNHDKMLDRDEIEHGDVRMHCYIQHFKARISEANEATDYAVEKVRATIDVLKELLLDVEDELDVKKKIQDTIHLLES